MLNKIFGNNLVAISKFKLALKLNKPVYIRMCISELSKVLMYEFHYYCFKNKYNNKSKLLLADTVSLIYKIIFMSMKILAAIKKCLISVINRLDRNTIIIQTNTSLEK